MKKKIKKPTFKQLAYHLRQIYLGYFLNEGFDFNLSVNYAEQATDIIMKITDYVASSDDASDDAEMEISLDDL